MFKVNDYVMYGTLGVCQVTGINKETLFGNTQKDYYVLNPVYSNNTIIKIPVDNDKVTMRKILSKDDLSSLLECLPNKKAFWIDDDKERNKQFKSILKSGDCNDLVTLVKSIYLFKCNRKELGKKLYKCDEDIFDIAERLINEEFATILNICPNEVPSYIKNHISL